MDRCDPARAGRDRISCDHPRALFHKFIVKCLIFFKAAQSDFPVELEEFIFCTRSSGIETGSEYKCGWLLDKTSDV